MRFFFKIFFTTILIAVTCTAAAGYVLIRDNVAALLEADTVRAVESGSVAAYALSAADPVGPEQILDTAAAMNITYGGESLRFALLDEDGGTVFSTLGDEYTQALASLRDPGNRTWRLSDVGGSSQVLALRPVRLGGVLYYVGTARNAGHIFDTQLRQYRLLLKILAVTVVVGGGVTLLVSRFLTRKLRIVAQTSRRIAGGDLRCRAEVRGDDEFARLADQFNRMADALEEKIAALQEENERRILFTGAFAHELKTPLTSIIGYADLLRTGARDDRTALCAGYIFSEGRRLETMAMRLLELIVLGQQELRPETVEAGAFFQRLSGAVAGSGGAVDLHVEPCLLRMEPALLHTVFLNLLDNGRKAAGPDGTVSLNGYVCGTDYVASVRDNGCGMAPEELAKIRRPFYRVDPSRSRAQGGAGLGLAICEEILTLHGFTLDFESAPGRGTVATVTMKGAVVS